ncbi:unnamed protein product [Ranitomeya imitator]|uniref:ribonuclease H n=1 Tax=Ranitomeya imitator TaxID=111125 RepID=A0ABN9L025_9NEOB|nr:unnamed protein product [Ranitomeya imitator]
MWKNASMEVEDVRDSEAAPPSSRNDETQRPTDRKLALHKKYVAAYLDDTMIFGKYFGSYLNKVQAILNALLKARFSINPKKCAMGMEEAKYLGYVVGRGPRRQLPCTDCVSAGRKAEHSGDVTAVLCFTAGGADSQCREADGGGRDRHRNQTLLQGRYEWWLQHQWGGTALIVALSPARHTGCTRTTSVCGYDWGRTATLATKPITQPKIALCCFYVTGGRIAKHIYRAILRLQNMSSDATMSSYSYETLKVTTPADHIYHVEINRPEKRNAMNKAFWREMVLCFQALGEDSNCRAVVISGSGKMFTSGIDLMDLASEFIQSTEEDAARIAWGVRKNIIEYQKSFSVIEKCTKPVIAAVHNGCIGGGVDLVSSLPVIFATVPRMPISKLRRWMWVWRQTWEPSSACRISLGTEANDLKSIGTQDQRREQPLCAFRVILTLRRRALSSAVQAAGSGAKDAMREGPAVTSRSCDRDVITGPALIPTLGPEAAACTAHKRQDYNGPSSEDDYQILFFLHSLVNELAFTARKMMSDEALSSGLVSRVFPDKASLLSAAFDLATDIASKSPVAVQGTKVNLLYARDHSVEDSLNYMATWNMSMLQTEDIMTSAQAAMQKKTPKDVTFSKL